jgi:hypothetical protein
MNLYDDQGQLIKLRDKDLKDYEERAWRAYHDQKDMPYVEISSRDLCGIINSLSIWRCRAIKAERDKA